MVVAAPFSSKLWVTKFCWYSETDTPRIPAMAEFGSTLFLNANALSACKKWCGLEPNAFSNAFSSRSQEVQSLLLDQSW